jgi:hypothetical protein
MKVVFVLEFDVVPGPDVEALTNQVGNGLAGMRQAQRGLEPVTSTWRETYIAVQESADAALAAVKP